jgi:hypothetical protein
MLQGQAAAAAQGIKFMALYMDRESLAAGYAPNMNILQQPNPGLTLDDFTELGIPMIAAMLGIDEEDIALEYVELPAGEAARLDYQIAGTVANGQGLTLHAMQFIFMHEGSQYVVSFGTLEEQFAEQEAMFLEIMDTFEVFE